MTVVHLPGPLRVYAGGLTDVEAAGASILEVLQAVADDHPELQPRLFDQSGNLSSHVLVFHLETLIKPELLDEATFDPTQRVDLLVPISGGGSDVRMRGFQDRVSVDVALAAALDGITPLDAEPVAVTGCWGRVLAADVASEVDVPPFRRSAMDGYAVKAEDTFGATSYDPVVLAVAGASMPGTGTSRAVVRGTAVRVMTGAPVPDGADAVLKAEDGTERSGRLEVRAAVTPGKNVGRAGEDVDAGTVVLRSGRRLRPSDAALLASIGHHPVSVHRRPHVRIVVSGDELLAPGELPGGTKIVDSNSVMLSGLVERDGGVPTVVRVPDDEAAMRSALSESGADLIVTSGAASVGTEDRVPILVAELGELRVHGVAMRPSSPAGVGTVCGTPVIILPGNPVSTLVAYDFFAGPAVRRLGGRPTAWPYPVVRLPLRQRLVSQIGRTDYVRVRFVDGGVAPVAISGASVLSSVTRADGFVVVPAGLEGYPEGDAVDVGCFAPDWER